MLSEEDWDQFKKDLLSKRVYAQDFEAYCERFSRGYSNPPRPNTFRVAPREMFTSLPAIAMVRYHNHPKTRERWYRF